jgi:hypothetical protein
MKLHEEVRRKKEYLNLPNEKFLEVRYNETFLQKGFWPPEAKVIVNYSGAIPLKVPGFYAKLYIKN